MNDSPHIERRVLIIRAGDQAVVRDVRSDQRAQHRARSLIIRLHEQAQLSYYDLQELSYETYELTVMTVIMDAYSQFTYEGVHTGAQHAKMIINLQIRGEGAQATIRAGSCAMDAQRHIFVTQQNHGVPNARSTCTVRSVLYDQAQAGYYGAITIDERAQGTNAHQQHKALLMGRGARAVARPSLAIKAHDVQCAHGSAMGQLDEEQLWYLQSRGIAHEDAERQLVGAFFSDLYQDEQLCTHMLRTVFAVENLE